MNISTNNYMTSNITVNVHSLTYHQKQTYNIRGNICILTNHDYLYNSLKQ